MTQPTNCRAVLEQALEPFKVLFEQAAAMNPAPANVRCQIAMRDLRALIYAHDALAAGRAALEQLQGEQARLGMRDGLNMALAIVELYGMKFDVIHREIAKLRDEIKVHPQASEPEPNPWKEAVLDQLAIHAMDAPVETPPAEIIQSIIDMAIAMATDLRVTDEPAQGERVEVDWQDQYWKQKRRAEMWIAKYEKDIGPLEKAYPVAPLQSTAQPDHIVDANKMVEQPVGELTDEQISSIYDWSGETPHLYFARAIIAAAKAQPERNPLTEDQISELHRDAYTTGKAFTTLEVYRYFARAIEAAHGIKGAES